MADIDRAIFNILYYTWLYKIQIVGGIFIGLTAFEYFYRYYLARIREGQLEKLKQRLLELKKSNMKNLSRDELEHIGLNANIEKLSNRIDSNNEVLTNQISTNNRVVIMQINTEFEVLNLRMDNSDKKIEGALIDIKNLKSDTKIIRDIRKYKLFVGASLASFITVTNWKQIEEWVRKFLPW